MSEHRSELGMGFAISGGAATQVEEAPEPVVAGGERFASRWHADRYVEDLKRDLAATEDKLAVKGLDETKCAELEEYRASVIADLERFKAV